MTDLTAKPLTDATKLRVLALWFDKWDETAYADRQAVLDDESNPGKNDVQRDLRRIADTLPAREGQGLDVERLAYALNRAFGAITVGGPYNAIGANPMAAAERLATEYAALAEAQQREGAGE